MKRIVLLYADTGGGHRSAAEAIARGIEQLFPGACAISLVNAIPHMAYPYNQMERTYPAVVNGPRFLHELSFHATNSRRRSWIVRALLHQSGAKMAALIVKQHPADVYVSCSPIYSQVLAYHLPRMGSRAKLAVVATDMVTGHAFNYAPEADITLVPTEYTQVEALQNGVEPSSIIITGQPVGADLRLRMAQGRATRAELGFDCRTPLVLLIGGGDGMGKLGPTARAIAMSGLPLQLAVVCGRNASVKRDLDRLDARTPLKTFGFVTNVPELMGAADILVTKAGAATVGEALIAGLPIVIYDAVPGQEDGNVSYLVQEGAGAWRPSPRAVVAQLDEWLKHPEAIERTRLASARLACPDAALEIAQAVMGLA